MSVPAVRKDSGTSRWLRYGLLLSLSDNDPGGGDAAEDSDILKQPIGPRPGPGGKRSVFFHTLFGVPANHGIAASQVLPNHRPPTQARCAILLVA